MKLLITAQVVDKSDPVLGFFHRWIEELAPKYDSIDVVCLYEGQHDLPASVRVHSLGKEDGERSRIAYAFTFLKYAWVFRDRYDAVFVHQNQEYLLIAGWLWRLLRKPAYLWRNHYAGSVFTDLAALFATKVFCTSAYSYTAKYRKTVLMPVGVDLERFALPEEMHREPRSILFLARIAASKRPEMLVDALGEVLARGVSFTATVVGSAADEAYARSVAARAESLGLHDRVRFLSGVPHAATPTLYAAHDLFVNCSPSGMFDKTLFEAAAAGCRVIAASDDFRSMAGEDAYAPDTEALAARLAEALSADEDTILRRRLQMQSLARGESLATLVDRIAVECS